MRRPVVNCACARDIADAVACSAEIWSRTRRLLVTRVVLRGAVECATGYPYHGREPRPGYDPHGYTSMTSLSAPPLQT